MPKFTTALKKTSAKQSKKKAALAYVRLQYTNAREGISNFLKRRPHRSFRPSSRSDYARSLRLPGYWAFTGFVCRTLWLHRKTFIWVVLAYAFLTGVFVGLASQDSYATLRESLQEVSGEVFAGDMGRIGEAGVLLLSGMMGGFVSTPTEAQQVYAVLIGLLVWLTTVWLLRAFQVGSRPRFRDGLYNAGAPIVPTFLLVGVAALQVLPAALAVIAVSAAVSTGFIDGGAISMIFSVGVALLCVLSAYWLTSTLIALVVVTLPGMYPLRALKSAGDIVIGRRLRILLRWLWLLGGLFVVWVVVMLPVIIFDAWIKDMWAAIDWLPIVPLGLLVVGSFSVLVSASYVYLLYRKVVDDDTKPA